MRKQNALGKNRFFDWKMGLIGGLFMGTVVYVVNASHGFNLAIVAALKQGMYTMFMGGFLMKLCENLSIRLDAKWRSIALAVLTTTSLSAIFTYGLHSLKGTPETVKSTLMTILFALPGFFWWAFKKRRSLEQAEEALTE